MRKKELKRRLDELEGQLRDGVERIEALGAYEITGKVAYVSAPDPYLGAAAVIDKLVKLDRSPTTLVITAQYIPAGADGEASYFAINGTASI